MNIRVFGVKIYVSPLFFVLITWMLLIDSTGVALPIITSYFIHEMGHLVAMKITKQKAVYIKLIPTAILIEGKCYSSDKDELFVTVAGVIFNCIFALIFYLIYIISGSLLYYSAANILVGVYNLLPIKGTDGGKILYIKLFKKSRKIYKILNWIFCASVGILGLALIYFGVLNESFYIFILYILIMSLIKV